MTSIMSYKNLEIWKLAREQSILIHKMSLRLPRFELYETGSQIRRSSKSIRSNIVEGYGRRRYKQEYIRFLIFSHSSVLETIDHLEALTETGSLSDQEQYQSIWKLLDECGRKLNKFIQGVEREY
jgi:four helix bundle protein